MMIEDEELERLRALMDAKIVELTEIAQAFQNRYMLIGAEEFCREKPRKRGKKALKLVKKP